MEFRGVLTDSQQIRFDTSELGYRAAAGLFVENLGMRYYNPTERHMRRFPGAEDPDEVSISMITSTWRRHGVGRPRRRTEAA